MHYPMVIPQPEPDERQQESENIYAQYRSTIADLERAIAKLQGDIRSVEVNMRRLFGAADRESTQLIVQNGLVREFMVSKGRIPKDIRQHNRNVEEANRARKGSEDGDTDAKALFRKIAMATHPDRVGDNLEIKDMMAQLFNDADAALAKGDLEQLKAIHAATKSKSTREGIEFYKYRIAQKQKELAEVQRLVMFHVFRELVIEKNATAAVGIFGQAIAKEILDRRAANIALIAEYMNVETLIAISNQTDPMRAQGVILREMDSRKDLKLLSDEDHALLFRAFVVTDDYATALRSLYGAFG